MSAVLESARRDWQEGHDGLQRASTDRRAAERLEAQVDVVIAELRRRLGGIFTLDELAVAYEGAERWAHTAIEEHAPVPGWALTWATATDAAFHRYARGAQDYRP